ncbi:MAG: radical SAM family heme chaperone HemW [Nitrospirae bacterium]|nr:radical SAM family heme chaperone HemW [Nitrospirota bacterium]
MDEIRECQPEIPGLYVSVPFCRGKCRYCAIPTRATALPPAERYRDALRREAAAARGPSSGFGSIYFGGGTPLTLSAAVLGRILEDMRGIFSFEDGVEVTLEANPGVLSRGDLERLAAAGFNRLSLGVQSLDDEELSFLGRIHTSDDALQAASWVRSAGFRQVSLDLIYGFPGHTIGRWRRTLDRVLSLGPDHLSIYAFTLEPGTYFHAAVREGRARLPGERDLLAMDEAARERLTAAGYDYYEISNAARAGAVCLHNLRIWRGGDVLGLGAAAHSLVSGWRWRNVADANAYMKSVEGAGSGAVGIHRVDGEGTLLERLLGGLRLDEGIPLSVLPNGDEQFAESIQSLVADEFLEAAGGMIRLGSRGRPVADSVILEVAAALGAQTG